MAVIRVLYASKKGKTKKVADAIAEVCGVEAIDMNIPSVIGSSDILFIGVPVYRGKAEPAVLDYLDQLPVNVIRGAALFCVSTDGVDHTGFVVNCLEHKGIEVYPRHKTVIGSSMFKNKGRPNEKDIEEAKEWAREVLSACNLV